MYNKLIFYFLLFICKSVFATGFLYPENQGDTLIGKKPDETHYILAKQEETLLDIARDFDIGQVEILLANPTVDRWLPGERAKVKIPNSRLLPEAPHQGVVLNIPEFRLYFYPKKTNNQAKVVITHPISIGRVDWDTPLGKSHIINKTRNPVWIPPKSIKEEHAAEGDILPDVFPAGPDNPLGLYALRLSVPGYLIHSTNKPYGVGMRVSHGCIRMYPEDIEKLFPLVKIGTPVHIVNQPIKVGWSENVLYVEIYPDLKGNEQSFEQKVNLTLDLIERANNNQLPVIDGNALKLAIIQSYGIPVAVFKRSVIPALEVDPKKNH